jgi:hypothetical protein
MKRLGELLIEKGAIDLSELHTALEACHRRGGRLGTNLLRFGFVEETALLEALSEQFNVPFVPERFLARSIENCEHRVPAAVLRRLQAVPFERTRWRLRVAMTSPRDPAALEELAAHTDLKIEPYVATEAAVMNSLQWLTDEAEAESKTEEAPEPTRPKLDLPDWEELWKAPTIGPDDLFKVRPAAVRSDNTPLLSTFPGLAPVVEMPGGGVDEVLEDEAFVQRLQEVRHRDDVGRLITRYAERFLGRVCLFALHKDRVVGWMACGQGVVLDDVQSFSIQLEESSLFSGVCRSGQHSLGPIPPAPAHDELIKILGEPRPLDVFVMPIRVKKRPVAILLGDNPGVGGGGVPTQELAAAVEKAGVAFEILIMKHKIRS